MVLALGAGKLFKLDDGGEYEETIIGKPSEFDRDYLRWTLT